MEETGVAIIGAGPAGLAAAIEVAQAGGEAVLIDENKKPGGQLFKQIHKFFGSRAHHAGVRGITIAENLLEECERLGVTTLLDTVAYGIFADNTIGLMSRGRAWTLKAEQIILAAGASENALSFPGWTLPGVMGAGALQTMINVHRVLPGKRILMVGSGNVGLIVSYQAMQAGAQVAAIVEAAPSIGGYGVHAAKISRTGTPIYTSHTVKRALGNDHVEGAELVALDERWNPIEGTEKHIPADTICLSVGLTPLTELARMAGCRFTYVPALGGHVPVHNWDMRTSKENIYIAGDISGIEEASTAMEEGRLAGIAAARSLGLIADNEAETLKAEIRTRLASLREGPFGKLRREMKEPFMKGPEIIHAG